MTFDLRAGAINFMPRGPFAEVVDGQTVRQRWKNLHRARREFQRHQDRLAASLKDMPDGPLKMQAAEKLIWPPIIIDESLPGV